MTKYIEPTFSRDDYRKASHAIKGDLIWSPERRDDVLRTFSTVNNWRDAHFRPMAFMQKSLTARIRSNNMVGLVASRAKRMSSIRKKIRRSGIHLDKIQDLAGCRAIMDDIASVNNLVESCKQTMPHTVRKHQDFIRDPKASGYRGHHIVWSFNGNGEDAPFDGLFVEMQVRTRLQHSWATAVEAVGLFLDEDLKASEGNEDWLRLFALMSAEFALTEMMPTHPSIPNTSARRLEIKNLEKKLDALSFLENLRIATEFVRTQITAFDRSSYFMLIYDRANQTVKVSPYTGVVRSASDFHREEMRISESHEDKKVVLVDVSGVESLADAYPNYFGDVAFFIRNLREVCLGKDAIEYSLVRQMAVASKKETPIDLSWFKRRHRWVE